MVADRRCINCPHLQRYLVLGWAFALAGMAVGAAGLLLGPFPSDAWLGGLVVNLMGFGFGAAFTLVFLDREQSVEVRGSRLIVATWLQRVRGKPPKHILPLSSIKTIEVAWPLELRLAVEENVVRVSTFWWRRNHYQAFQQMAEELDLSVVYERAYPGYRPRH